MFLSFQKITQALRNVSAVVSDVYFNLVTLLVNTTGTNGAQNNTFIDESVNNFTITRNGVTTQGTFTPFSQTGWSNYISTANGYVKMPVRAAYGVGTGNFTLEGFFNVDGRGTRKPFTVGNVTAESIAVTFTNTNLRIDIAGTTSIIDTAYAVPLNRWNHIAFVRSGTGTGQVNLYVNGAYVANGTSSGSIVASDVQYGGIDWSGGFGLVGFYSNFRYSNVARYSGATYTVPTAPFTTDANTLALAAQSNSFVNNSSLGGNLTVSAASVQAIEPFNSNVSYSTSTIGGSAYLNGTTDYLTWPGNSVTTAFTFECYFYYTGDFSAIAAFCGPGANTNNALNLYINNNTQLTVDQYGVTGTNFTVPTMAANQWYHVAFCRNSSNQTSVFLNGTRSTTGNVLINTSFQNIAAIGYVSPAVPRYFNGYLSGVKYSQSALYNVASTTITIPTSPANTANAALCLNFTNAGIFDSAAKNVLRTVGNASVSTAQTKFGTSSMFFDGTGDYVSAAPVNIINAINNANCTIEMWVYSSNSSASLKCLVDTRTGLSNSTGYGIYQIANNVVIFGGGLRGNAVASLTGNTWTHVAVTRANVTNYVFIGGTLYNTFTYGNTLSSGNVTIGADVAGSNAFTGYIDEVRITDGFARYTANFTPTTTAFPTQ